MGLVCSERKKTHWVCAQSQAPTVSGQLASVYCGAGNLKLFPAMAKERLGELVLV